MFKGRRLAAGGRTVLVLVRDAARRENLMKFNAIATIVAALALAACNPVRESAPASSKSSPDADAAVLLDAAISGPQRSAEDRARDPSRHPKETLSFFGVEPTMTVIEVWPGGGWYTKIIAPYLKSGGGTYYAAQVDPSSSARAAASVEKFRAEFGDQSLYGDIRITRLAAGEIAPDGSVDAVLTFRNVHNWIASDAAESNFKMFYRALKPGGVLGVVEHRANENADEKSGASGYIKESTVKAFAISAGFEFIASSEINANPKDTKDHPFGVWTLPPVRRASLSPGQEDPAFDHAKYDAIGESDRMTLKFVKPQS